MVSRERPLDEYFDAARSEPGISEDDVRAIVSRPTGRERARRRWIIGVAFLAASIAIGIATTRLGAGHDGASPARGVTRAATSATADRTTADRTPADRATARDETTVAGADHTTATTTPLIAGGDTMTRRNIMRGATALALVAGAGVHANAQSDAPTEKRKEIRQEIRIEHRAELSPIMDKMATELGRQAAEFWTARLNGYKARIDRMLTPADLEKLNRMRVRFGVMLADHAELRAHSEVKVADDAEKRVVVRNEKRIVNGETTESNDKRKIEIRVEASSDDALEILGLHQEVKGLAESYRDNMDALGRDVLADAATFLRTMKEAGNRFVEANRVEVERTEDGKHMAMALSAGDDVVNALNDPESQPMIQMVYSMAVEPLIMLYDGSDLANFFQQGPLSSAVTGLKLPETNALRQNVPNPATSKTTISYVLEQPSSETTLRVYDASGALVGTYDQGAVEAGEHSATIDLSSVPSGVYLYHLTVKTPAGERVFSKAMQVAK
jgi:hypothetical protein